MPRGAEKKITHCSRWRMSIAPFDTIVNSNGARWSCLIWLVRIYHCPHIIMHQTNPKINSAANSVVAKLTASSWITNSLTQSSSSVSVARHGWVPKGLRCINGILLSDILDSIEASMHRRLERTKKSIPKMSQDLTDK